MDKMLRRSLVLLILLVCCMLTGGVEASILEVGLSGYTYTSIQAAINAAVPGDTVLVHYGTYKENIAFSGKAITVKSVNGAAKTIIDANGSGRGVRFNSGEGSGSVLDGFTITNGYALLAAGGGIQCYNASPTISNCTITGNYASYNGGGISCYGEASPTISNCTISGNTSSDGWGGGISCGYSSHPSITNCIISGNNGWRGSAISCDTSCSPTITSCTITRNVGNLGAIYIYASSSPSVKNTILWENTPNEIYFEPTPPSSITITYSNVNQDGYAGSNGNIRQNPLFIDPANGNFRLQPTSPCIDAATSDGAPLKDMNANPRFDLPSIPNTGGGTHPYYDMGALELVIGIIINDLFNYVDDASLTAVWSRVSGTSSSIFLAPDPSDPSNQTVEQTIEAGRLRQVIIGGIVPTAQEPVIIFSFDLYDTTGGAASGRVHAELRNSLTPNGLLAAGIYNSVNVGTLDITRYQARAIDAGGWIQLAAPRSVGWHNFRFEITGNRADLYVDNVLDANFTGLAAGSATYDWVHIGSGLSGSTPAYFDNVYVATVPRPSGQPIVDFDGDRKTDIAVYRASTGTWYLKPSGGGAPYAIGWGGDPTDKPIPGDYNGDSKTDITVYRSSTGAWYVYPSGGGTPYGFGWGGDPTDKPVPGDYDGDLKTDYAVYRASTGAWYVYPSASGIPYGFGWGGDPTDKPVPGDYDGDGETDIAVYRANTGAWYVKPSSGVAAYGVGWGGDPSDKPVPSDYDGDGKTDIAVYRASTGAWYVKPSNGGAPYGTGWGGDSTDVPVITNPSSYM